MYLSFFVQAPELGLKLYKMLEEVFGYEPLVLKSDVNDRYIFIARNNFSSELELSNLVYFKKTEIFKKNSTLKVDLSTDDWPFIYMPLKVYPLTYFFVVIILITSSIIFLNRVIKIKKSDFSFICFFRSRFYVGCSNALQKWPKFTEVPGWLPVLLYLS